MEETEPPECPVCLQTYDAVSAVPRVLTCGHTTCEACLKQLPIPFPNTLRCTVCTLLVKIPNSISALPKNLDLLHFSSALQHQSKGKKVNSPSSPPEGGKNNPVLFPMNMKSWSYEFYRRWKKWVIPKDCILIENLGPDEDGGVVSGKILKSLEGDHLMGFVFRENENVGLVKVGIFVEDQEDSKFFKFSYESRIVSVLCGMKEDERDELGIILNVSVRLSNVRRAYGFWYNEDDSSVYTVWQKFTSHNLMEFVLHKKDDEEKKLTIDEISGLGMLGMEMCETLSRLHSEGLVMGFLSVSCFSFDEFGRVYIDLNEVLNMDNRLKNNLPNENFVFISPEMLLQFVNKGGFDFDVVKSRHEFGYASDVWSLASLLVWLIVGSSYLEETESFLKLVVNAIKDEKSRDCSDLHIIWMEKISELLKRRLGSECYYLQENLCKCLGYDPGNRPVVTELWKCFRELIIKPQIDIMLSLRQEEKKENPGNYIVLGETHHVVEEIVKGLINGVNGNYKNDAADDGVNGNYKNDAADVESEVDGDVFEGMSRGRIRCVEMKGHLDSITGLTVGGGFLFSSSYDMVVHVWSLQDFTHVHSFKGHEHRIRAVVFVDGENQLCISGDYEGVICIWKANFPFSDLPIIKLCEKKDWRYSGIHAMAISGTGYLYTGSGDKLVKAWSLQDYTLSCEMSGHKAVVSSLIVSDGVLFSGSWDGTVRLWSLSDHSPLSVLAEEKFGNASTVLSLSADHNLLFVGHENGSIKIWHNDALVKSTQAHKGAIFSVNKKGKWLFSGGWGKTINLQEISEDVDGVDVTPVGSIPCNSVITALLYWNEKLFVGQGDSIIKVYHGV